MYIVGPLCILWFKFCQGAPSRRSYYFDITLIFLVHLIFRDEVVIGWSFWEIIDTIFWKYYISKTTNILRGRIHFLQNLDSSPVLRCGICKPYEWVDFLLWRAISFSLNNSSIFSANSLKMILNIFYTIQAIKNYHYHYQTPSSQQGKNLKPIVHLR